MNTTNHTQQKWYCHEVKYIDGDTLSIGSVKSKPRETICKILELKREVAQVTAQRDELLAAAKRFHAIAGKLDHDSICTTDYWNEYVIAQDEFLDAITKAEQH